MKVPLHQFLVIIILSFVLVVESCKFQSKEDKSGDRTKIDSLSWFSGNWSGKMNGGIFTENWQKVNDSVFDGHSFFIKANDTLGQEVITIEQHGTSLFYVPIAKGQNDDKPVFFRLTYLDMANAVFENPNHDFPQKIAYQFKENDSLIAVISGTANGNYKSIRFPMSRQKDAGPGKQIK